MKIPRQLSNQQEHKASMRFRLLCSIISVCIILVASAFISLYEYGRVSSKLKCITDANRVINVLNRISGEVAEYEMSLMELIGEESLEEAPVFDTDSFKASCDSCVAMMSKMGCLLDSAPLYASLDAYMGEASKLETIIMADFVDNQVWFYENLQPLYFNLCANLGSFVGQVQDAMHKDSEQFERGFYSSIMPGAVASGVSVLLLLLLAFFIIRLYVNPIYKMLAAFNAYRSNDKSYNYSLQSGDQLSELNAGIAEIVAENKQLRQRIRQLKHSAQNQSADGQDQ